MRRLATRVAQRVAIAHEHLEVCETPVRQQHGLRALQVRVSGNNDFAVRFGKVE